MKILFSSNKNPNFITITEYIEKALKKEGEVLFFENRSFMLPGRIRGKIKFLQDFDLNRMNKNLLKAADSFKPDIFIEAGGYRILPETVRELKGKGIKTVLWTIDPPANFDPIIKAGGHYDFIFTGGSEAGDSLKEYGISTAHFLPFAADLDVHKRVNVSEPERSSYEADIAFVGSIDPKRYYHRGSILEGISDFNLSVWGPGAEKIDNNFNLRNKIRGDSLRPEDWRKVYSLAKIGICAHFKDKEGKVLCHQLSPRVYEIMACKCFLLVDAQRDIDRLFVDGKHLVIFKDKDDLRKKIEYYLARSQERARIAEAGYIRIVEKNTYIHRIKEMMRIIGGINE